MPTASMPDPLLGVVTARFPLQDTEAWNRSSLLEVVLPGASARPGPDERLLVGERAPVAMSYAM